LNEDIGCALPYLNTLLGADQYFTDPPELMLHHHGRIIKVGCREIAINALKDDEEAERILAWLQTEINHAWDNRETISPSYSGRRKPKLIDILKLLPKTNCRECGLPTCMVFAAQVVEGGRDANQCPALDDERREKLSDYLSDFTWD
jgi:ArsR family metal-binding transcriptional regulator